MNIEYSTKQKTKVKFTYLVFFAVTELFDNGCNYLVTCIYIVVVVSLLVTWWRY